MYSLFEALNPQDDRMLEKAAVKNGISLAQITGINDPKNLGRVKCAYITAEEDAGETGWMFCVTPFGGSEYGAFFHPNVGDIVAIAYENGDIHRPFVIGSLWVGDNKPPLTVQDGANNEYKLITPNKSFVDFSDEQGKEKITVSTPKNRQIVLDDENGEISVTDGKTSIKITEKDGTAEINCDKKLVIKVGSGASVEIDGTSGAIKINANKEINISSAQITEKASGTAEISANGSLDLKSSGIVTVKGSMTKIN